MARSINKVILIGHLGQDAETKFTRGGAAVTRFSVATNRSWKDQQTNEWKEETNWTNIVLWSQESLANFLTKGKQVYIEGRLQSRSYEDRDGRKAYVTEVIANEILLLGAKNGQHSDAAEPPELSSARSATTRQHRSASSSADTSMGITDDDDPW
jgi:single-strand DNA-binding protein